MAPELPDILPGPRRFGRRADAADFGGAQAEALEQRGQLVRQVGGALAEVASDEERLYAARQKARVGRQAAELAAGDDELALRFETDPDLDTQEERFEKDRADRLRAAQAQLPDEFHELLEERAFASGAHTRGRIRAGITRRRLEDSRADLAEAGRQESDRAARATSPGQRDQIREGFRGDVSAQQEAGVLNQAQADALLREFDRGVSGADVREMIAADPLRALSEMQDPQSAMLRGYDAEEVEVWKERALDAYRQQLGEQRAARAEVRANLERAEKDAREAAMRGVIDAAAGGDPAALAAQLQQNRDLLSPEQYEQGRKWLRNGSFATQRTNPQLYIELSNQAARGVPVGPVADEAVVQGLLSASDRDKLLRLSQGKRFDGARNLLEAPTRRGVLDKYDPTKSLRDAEMLKEFDDWAIEHPEATSKEAADQAYGMLQRAGYREAATLEPPAFSPAGATPDEIEAQAAARWKAGKISAAQRDAELERAEALRDVQQRIGGQK